MKRVIIIFLVLMIAGFMMSGCAINYPYQIDDLDRYESVFSDVLMKNVTGYALENDEVALVYAFSDDYSEWLAAQNENNRIFGVTLLNNAGEPIDQILCEAKDADAALAQMVENTNEDVDKEEHIVWDYYNALVAEGNIPLTETQQWDTINELCCAYVLNGIGSIPESEYEIAEFKQFCDGAMYLFEDTDVFVTTEFGEKKPFKMTLYRDIFIRDSVVLSLGCKFVDQPFDIDGYAIKYEVTGTYTLPSYRLN